MSGHEAAASSRSTTLAANAAASSQSATLAANAATSQPLPLHPRELGPAQAPKHRGYYFDQFGMRQWVDPQRRRGAGAATRPRCKTYGFPCPSCAQDVALEQGAPCVACAPPELLCACKKEAGSCWRCAQDARAIASSNRVQSFQGYGRPMGEGGSNHEAWLCHACGYHIVFQANSEARTVLRVHATEAHELICPLLATGKMTIG